MAAMVNSAGCYLHIRHIRHGDEEKLNHGGISECHRFFKKPSLPVFVLGTRLREMRIPSDDVVKEVILHWSDHVQKPKKEDRVGCLFFFDPLWAEEVFVRTVWCSKPIGF